MASIEGIDVSIQVQTDTRQIIALTAALTGLSNKLGVAFESAAQAQQSLGGLTTNISKVTKHVSALGDDAIKTGRGMQKAASDLERFISTLGPGEKAAVKYGQALRVIRDAHAKGLIDHAQAEQLKSLAIEQRRAAETSAEAAAAAKAEAEEKKRKAEADRLAAQSARNLAKEQRAEAQEAKRSARETREQIAVLNQLRREFTPLTAEVNRLREANSKLVALRNRGLIQDTEFHALSQAVQRQFHVARSAEDAAKKTSRLTNTFRNLESASVIAIGPLSRLGAIVRGFGTIIARSGIAAGLFFGTVAIGGFALFKLGQALVRTRMEFDRLEGAMRAAFSSAALASQQFDEMLEVQRRLGLDLTSLTAAYAKFAGAAISAGLPLSDLRDTFEGFVTAGTAMRLSSDDIAGTLRALEQMFGKNVIQAEEFRQQLAERMPVALSVAIAAFNKLNAEAITAGDTLKATGGRLFTLMRLGELSPRQLIPEMGRIFQDLFAAEAALNARTIQAQFNNLRTSVDLLFRELDNLLGLTDKVGRFASGLQKIAEGLREASISFGGSFVMEPISRDLTLLDEFIKRSEKMAPPAEAINAEIERAAKNAETLIDAINSVRSKVDETEQSMFLSFMTENFDVFGEGLKKHKSNLENYLGLLRLLIQDTLKLEQLIAAGPPTSPAFDKASDSLLDLIEDFEVAQRQIGLFFAMGSEGSLKMAKNFLDAKRRVKEFLPQDFTAFAETMEALGKRSPEFAAGLDINRLAELGRQAAKEGDKVSQIVKDEIAQAWALVSTRTGDAVEKAADYKAAVARTPKFLDEIARELADMEEQTRTLLAPLSDQEDIRLMGERQKLWIELEDKLKHVQVFGEDALTILVSMDGALGKLQATTKKFNLDMIVRSLKLELFEASRLMDEFSAGGNFAAIEKTFETARRAFQAIEGSTAKGLVSFDQVFDAISHGPNMLGFIGPLTEAQNFIVRIINDLRLMKAVAEDINFLRMSHELDMAQTKLDMQKQTLLLSVDAHKVENAVIAKKIELLQAGVDLEDARSKEIIERTRALTKEQVALERARQFVEDFVSTFSNGLAEILLDFNNINDAINRLDKALLNLMLNAFVMKPIENALSNAFMSSGAGGFLGNLLGMFFGFAAGPSVSAVNNMANPAALTGLGKMQHGGSFTVQGPSGVDNVVPLFRASPGETVTVTPRGKSAGDGGGMTVNILGGIHVSGPMTREQSRATARQLMDDILDQSRTALVRRG